MAAAAAAWPVCTICYEDLRPLSDQHLHCLPSCGHVFHALCLEQWLEYCPGGKRKLTCPICKQACAAGRAPTRLYFQSTGAGPTQSLPEAASADADPEAVAAEVARLQQKAASFSKVVEEQRAVIQKLKAEVVRWREQAAEEEVKHESIRKDKEYVQQMLIVKTEELLRKTSECTRLQEKSLALAKELAALKLSTDTNLEEEEILKLASLGNYGKLEHACDVLKRSLALRNKSYKELMARCNILGRSESRAQLKLDKSKEQIKKLKTRVQELEKEFEEKENQALRDLRFLKKLKTDRANSSQCPTAGIGNQTMGPDEMLLDPDTSTFSCNDRPHLNQCLNVPKVNGDLNSKSTIDNKNVNVIDLDADTSAFVDKNDMGFFPNQFENFNNASEFRRQPSLSEHKNKESTTSSLVAEDTSYSKYTVGAMKSALPHNLMKNTEKNLQESPIDGSATVTTSTLTIAGISKKATSLASGTGPQQIYNANSFSDDFQMPAGTLGAEGAKKSISKWCKGFTTPVSLNVNAARNSRNLISVGPDGRGGKVKVLRDLGPFQDSKTQTLWPKTQKLGGRGGQCQIDHFFGRR